MTIRARALAAGLLVAFAGLTAAPASAQVARAGVVSTLKGTATVARLSLPEPAPLKFRDSVFLEDRITTGDDSLVRVVLGGKAMITLRERTVVTVTEAPGAATLNVSSGRVMLGVARSLMRPGEKVEVVTPNLVAAIRGTVIVVEVTSVPEGIRSTVTVLHGLIDVTRYDSGEAVKVGPVVPVADLQQVVVTSDEPVPAPRRLTPETVRELGESFGVGAARAQHRISTTDRVVENALQNARSLLTVPGALNGVVDGRLPAGGSAPAVSTTVGSVSGAVGGLSGGVGGTLSGGGGTLGGGGGALGGVGGSSVAPIVPHLLH